MLVLDRVSGRATSGGFVFHPKQPTGRARSGCAARCSPGSTATAGAYVREGCEPIVKPGRATEALLKAATANMERPPSRHRRSPARRRRRRAASSATWEEAYPKGAEPTEDRLFADSIRYEDFNYPEPFVGKPAVLEFVTAFDIPNVEFVPLKISDGDGRCASRGKWWSTARTGRRASRSTRSTATARSTSSATSRRRRRGLPARGRARGGGRPRAAPLSAAKLTSAALNVGSMGMGLLKPSSTRRPSCRRSCWAATTRAPRR